MLNARRKWRLFFSTKGEYHIMREKIEEALKHIRPALQADGGDIELVSVQEGGVVKVRLRGACGSCPSALMTLKYGVEERLKEQFPEVTSVELA